MVGAGGHGKSVLNVLWQMGLVVEAVIDSAPEKWGTELLGVPVISPDSDIAIEKNRSAIIAVGENEVRKKLVQQFAHFDWITAISPLATVYPHAKIGKGSVIFPGALIGADAIVGEHVIVGGQSVVAHDSVLENFTHVASGVTVAGGATIKQGAFLATGSNVIPKIKVGSWALLGAGATATRDIPDNAKAIAPPPKILLKK